MSFVMDKQQVETLKASAKLVGPLNRVIVSSRSGRIISGRHRKFADPDWPEEKRDFKNDYEEVLARINANKQRQVSEEEEKLDFKHLAEATVADMHVEPEKVCSYLTEKLAGLYSQRRVEQLLEPQYKAKTIPKKVETVSTSTLQLIDQMKREGQEAKEALDRLEQTLPSGELTFPFPDCHCDKCPHKHDCY